MLMLLANAHASDSYKNANITVNKEEKALNSGWIGWSGQAFPNSFSFFMQNIHFRHKNSSFGSYKKNIGYQKGKWERPQQFSIVFSGIQLGAYVNTFHKYCYILGVKRNIFRKKLFGNAPFYYSINYGLGLVYGYNKKFLPLADKLPVLPYGIIGMNLEMGFFGFEAAVAGDVFNIFLYLKFSID